MMTLPLLLALTAGLAQEAPATEPPETPSSDESEEAPAAEVEEAPAAEVEEAPAAEVEEAPAAEAEEEESLLPAEMGDSKVWLIQSLFPERFSSDDAVQVRVSVQQLSDFPVDAEGSSVAGEADQLLFAESRVRLHSTEQTAKGHVFEIEADALSGPIGPSQWSVPDSADERKRNAGMDLGRDAVSLRQFNLSGGSSARSWSVGLDTSHWGLGMLSNDGSRDPLFGNSEFGDRVIRGRYTLAPEGGLPVSLTFALDQVIADDMARITERQLANQAVVSAYAGQGLFGTGLYAAYRFQREWVAERSTHAGIADWFLRVPVPLGESAGLLFGVEAASVFGRTARSLSYNERDGLWMHSTGALMELDLHLLKAHSVLSVRTGFASADSNPDDAWLRDFTFDRNLGVGLVMFDEFMGAVEAATYALLADPEHSGSPPDGVDAITTEGAFRRASFVQAVGQWEGHGSLEGIRLKVGGLLARSNAPITQPFYTFRSGGSAMSHHNQPSEDRLIGSELDWGMHYTHPAQSWMRWGMRLEGGHFWPSATLKGDGPARVDKILLTNQLSF